MRRALRIGFVGLVLVAMLGGCGSGKSIAVSADKRAPQGPASRAPARIVVAHRVGPRRIERGEPTEVLSASPCPNKGLEGTTTVPIGPDVGYCAQVAPSGRLRVDNTTASPTHVELGDYEMRLLPGQIGTIPALVRNYLGGGGHGVRVTGEGLDSTIWVLVPGCVLRWPANAGEELCFPRWVRHRKRVAGLRRVEDPTDGRPDR